MGEVYRVVLELVGVVARGYDVTADGSRFLMVRTVTAAPTRPSQMVLV